MELHTGFRLHLNTLSRNVISVSCLDNNMHECKFVNKQFELNYYNKNVGLGVRRGQLQILSMNDSILHMSDVCYVENK